jgi:hypothetical protein
MAIVNTIRTATQFADEFNRISPNTFTFAALETLFEYLDEMSESVGKNIEMDPVAIRCDWGEYSASELWDEFADRDEAEDCEDVDDLAAVLSDNGAVLRVEQPNREDTFLVAVDI